jgi:hypothetical protein
VENPFTTPWLQGIFVGGCYNRQVTDIGGHAAAHGNPLQPSASLSQSAVVSDRMLGGISKRRENELHHPSQWH